MQYNIILEYSPSENYNPVHLNLSAFLLNTNEKAEGNDCFVYYKNPVSVGKAVRCNSEYNSEKTSSEKNKKEIITVDVDSIPANIHKIVFVVTANDGENTPEYIKQAKETGICSLYTDDLESPVHSLEFTDTDFEGGVIFYEIVRSQTGWTHRLIATGSKKTLHDFAKIYGIETEKIVLSQEVQQLKEKKETPPSPPPYSPSPPLQSQQSKQPLQSQPPKQPKVIEENIIATRLLEENKLLKQQLQIERNRFVKLLEKYNKLAKENNLLFEQQLKNSNLLSELQILFSESSQYHFADMLFRDTLEMYRNKLAEVQSLNIILSIVEELREWWNVYRVQKATRLPFWRPDSWSRFENKFPNHPITIKLMYFTK
ncbi:MAG: TerD family protein [Planctomycetaceae bacterium]|jgi:tellurium resistance protein TerD|nr:TerD family protein [Planctomycetaceae bacterium]